MTRPRLSLVLAAVLGGAPGLAAASPSQDPPDHSYTYLAKGNVTVFGDSQGVERALRFQRGDAALLWFREGGQEYIVRDPDTIAQLEAAWTPDRALDGEARELERQRDGLWRKRDQLAARRDELAARRDALTERESELAARDAQRRELERQQQALAAAQRALEPAMKENRGQLDAIERRIDAVRAKRDLAPRNPEVCARFRRAIAAGKATPAR